MRCASTQRAPVERLDAHARRQPGVAHRLGDRGRERLRVRRLGRREVGVILVSMLKRTCSAPTRFTRSNSSASAGMRAPSTGLLRRQARRIGAAGLEPADVVALHLGQRERADRRAFGAEELSVRTARMVRVETAVMAHHQHVVLGHREIELERRDADRQRARRTPQACFRARGRACRDGPAGRTPCAGRRAGPTSTMIESARLITPSIAQPRNNPTTPCTSSAAEIRNISA